MPRKKIFEKKEITPELESHFLEHTRILTKKRKNYPGRKKPEHLKKPEELKKPQVMYKPKNGLEGSTIMLPKQCVYNCAYCGEPYEQWEKHKDECKADGEVQKPVHFVRCEECDEEVDAWTHWAEKHLHYKKEPENTEVILPIMRKYPQLTEKKVNGVVLPALDERACLYCGEVPFEGWAEHNCDGIDYMNIGVEAKEFTKRQRKTQKNSRNMAAHQVKLYFRALAKKYANEAKN